MTQENPEEPTATRTQSREPATSGLDRVRKAAREDRRLRLMKFVEHRVADPRMLRLIRKWLRAGVSEDGAWSRTRVGVPQGAVISPLLLRTSTCTTF